MRDSRHQTATVYSLVLLFGIVSSSCATTFSKEQIADNSAALAQTFVDCVWDIDPEIYFDDARLAGHAFRHAPRVMKSAEYHGKPGTRNSRGLAGQQHFEESRLFSLDLPIVPANAIDEKREPTELPAQFCLQVSVRYEVDAAVYYFEFFTPRVAIHKQQRLVRDGKYVADLDARSDYALPAAADAVIADLQKRGLPLDFAAQVFKVSDDLRAVKTGAEFLMGSGRVLVTEDVNSASTRLDQLQAIVRLRDGMTARSLYDRVLKIDSVRNSLAEHARQLTDARSSGAKRIASARANEKAEADRIARRELAARRARDTDMFLEVLAEGANELNSWSRQQSNRYSGSGSAAQSRSAANQRAIEESYEKGRIRGQIAAAERKIAADNRRSALARQRQTKARQDRSHDKLEDQVRDFGKRWHDFEVELAIVGRDLLRTEFVEAKSKYAELKKQRQSLDAQLHKAGLKPTNLASQDIWFQVAKKKLARRKKGVRSRLRQLQAPSGEKWSEHFIAKIAGVKFYQRVRARKWPDKAVDLAWRVVNDNNYPVWHSLDEDAPAAGRKSYLWGGSELKPRGEHLHEWVTYEADRIDWRFEAFVRREN